MILERLNALCAVQQNIGVENKGLGVCVNSHRLLHLHIGGAAVADTGSGSLNGSVADEGQHHGLLSHADIDVDEAACAFGFDFAGQQEHGVLGGNIVAEHGGLTITLGAADEDGKSEEEVSGDLHEALADVLLGLSSELDCVELLGGFDHGASGKSEDCGEGGADD